MQYPKNHLAFRILTQSSVDSQAYLKPSQTSKMELFVKISSILDVRMASEYDVRLGSE